MSNNYTPKTLDQLKMALQAVSRGVTALNENDANEEPLSALLVTFAKIAITPFVTHEQLYPDCTPPIHPSSNTEELKQIQSTLQALSRAVTGLQKKAPPPSKPPQPTNPLPSYASKASTKPTNPSIVVSLSHLDADTKLRRSRPAELCSTINNALRVTPHNQVHVSAVGPRRETWSLLGDT
jgi:hypothetical protein